MNEKTSHNLIPTPKTLAICLHIFNGVISANTFIYITALFLSSYPIRWVPYFFIGRTVIEIVTSFLVAPFLLKNSVRSALILETSSVLIISITFYLLTKHWFLLPLIFSFILTIASLISDLITWNNTRNAFDILEFKQISPALSLASVSGKIVFSLANIFVIKQFGINYLPYTIILSLFFSCYFIYLLTPLPIIISTLNPVSSPVRYPLFRNLFFYSLLLAFCYTLVDYALRYQLASAYNSEQIGLFMSIFTAITYFLATIITYLFSKLLLKVNIVSLLQVLPIYWIIIPIGVIFYPGMIMVTLMGAGDYVFFNFINIARGLFINVLPVEIRTVSQVSIKTVAESIGIGSASLFLILIAHYISMPVLAYCVLLCAVVLIIYAPKLHANYISTLKSEILLKRFHVDESDIGPYQQIIESNVNQFLASTDPQKIRFGYALLGSINKTKLPTIVLNHLYYLYPDIRIEAIKAITDYKELSMLDDLLQLFANETDPEVKWWLINAFAELQPTQFLDKAKKWVNADNPEIKAGGIRLLFLSENKSDNDLAAATLTQMLGNKDPLIRRIASRVLIHVPLEKVNAYLPIYVSDADDIVSSYDIEAIIKFHLDEFAPLIISRISRGGVFYSARKFINKIGDTGISLLKKAILDHQHDVRVRNDILISLLAQIRSLKVDEVLIEIAQLPGTLIKQAVAFQVLFRAAHLQLSEKITQQALQFAMNEAELIHVLHIVIGTYNENYIKNELRARINLAFERFICWIGVYTNSSETHGLVPAILHGNKLDQAKAIELLSTLIPNRELAQITLDIFSNKYIARFRNLSKPIHYFYDAWISEVIKTPFLHQVGPAMNQMQRIYILRQVELFKNLPAEVLMIIAEETDTLSIVPEQVIFLENDQPTDLFIVASGTVHIIRQNVLLAELKENSFFGELALIDNTPRTASAIAKSEGMLLVLHKEVFERIINDLPQVLLSVTQTILHYLRVNLASK